MIRISAILNTHSGSLKGSDLAELEQRLHEALTAPLFRIVSINRSDRPIDDEIEAAVTAESDCILIGGGDGSVSAAAAAAWRSGKILAVLPGGTMNLYARTLGMPLDLDESIRALGTAREERMDIATANGVPFIHQYTVGLHADAVRLRQRSNYDSRLGKIMATVRAFASVVFDPSTFPVTVRGDTLDERTLRLSALSVSNNLFGEGHLPYADEPDGGRLGLYLADPLDPWSAARLMLDIVSGEYAANEDVGIRSANRIELEFPSRRHPGRALLDGELVAVEPSVEIVMHADAIRVLRPERTDA